MGDATLSYVSGCDCARALGRRHFHRLHVARLSLDLHGRNERALVETGRSWRGPANPDRVTGRRFDLVRFFPAITRANDRADVPNLFYRNEMTGIPAHHLEIDVIVLGIAILLLETFAPKIEKIKLAYAGIVGLTLVLIATFFLSPETSPPTATGFWSFYTADPLSIFFKRFSLVTTIAVLAMMIDYAPALRKADASTSANLGEFFSLPLLTCAGLMYLVSAIDFIFIFVSLDLVTISFFVLVSFPRRNPIALEAGVKYLILGALSTAFLVYGITWIFGVTGETNLARITASFASGKIDNHAATFGAVLVLVGLGFKIAAVPFQMWVPDVYQGAPTPVTAFLSVGSKAAGFVVLLRVLQPFLMLPNMQRLVVLIALLTVVYGNLAALPQNNLKRL